MWIQMKGEVGKDKLPKGKRIKDKEWGVKRESREEYIHKLTK